MKNSIKLVLLAIVATITLAGCKVGMTSEAKGRNQEAYLQLIQTVTKYENGVSVSVDNNAPFTAMVDKQTKMGVKGNVYTIPTGRHRITISVDGKVIYSKEIFTSSQETKQIKLP
jgi:hypothetical protein